MVLELYQIFILITIGALVGIGMTFIGQTGQGLVMPIVLILTGNVFLTIAVNILNDLIAAAAVSIGYLRKKEFKLQMNTFILIIVALLFSLIGIYILMVTPLGNIYGWFIPAFIICLGIFFIKSGYTSTERLKILVRNIYKRFLKNNQQDASLNVTHNETVDNENIREVIPVGSKLFYIIAVIFGLFMGFNSGMFGANSGLIIVLALVILYGYPIKKGIGTALILSIIVSSITLILYQVFGILIKDSFYFNLEISIFLAIGSIITGILTSTYIQHLSAKTMGRAMGIVMTCLGALALTFYLITR